MKRINPKEAQALLESGWKYLDVRSEPEFERNHPDGAFNVPLLHASPGGMRPNPEFLAVVEKCFPKDTPLVVGCQAGGRSLKAAALLEQAGYQQIVDQRCGFGGSVGPTGQPEPGWEAEGLPTERGRPSGRSYPDLSKR